MAKGKIIRNRSALKSNKVPGLSDRPAAITYGGQDNTAVVPYNPKQGSSPSRRIGSTVPARL